MSQYDVIYPAIEQIIDEEFARTHDYVSRDRIASALLRNPAARQFIETSLGLAPCPADQAWEKAGNYVDWFNADITDNDPHTAKWNDGYYVRVHTSSEHRYSGKTRPIYALMPNAADLAEDVKHILDDAGLTETEKTRLAQCRLGQGAFRAALIEYWHRCALTGCSELRVLRASHIKPWRACSNPERLDPFNGLLLIANLDVAFDTGLITFDEFGSMLISPSLSHANTTMLGINIGMKVTMTDRHTGYMAYHREHVFKTGIGLDGDLPAVP
ncbi:MAG: HNH endonuclease [Planctomycetota bacterium]|nr:HNH endonuclease [Planctomycetota bacterium]